MWSEFVKGLPVLSITLVRNLLEKEDALAQRRRPSGYFRMVSISAIPFLDLSATGPVSFDNQRPGHAAGHLQRGGSVAVRMVLRKFPQDGRRGRSYSYSKALPFGPNSSRTLSLLPVGDTWRPCVWRLVVLKQVGMVWVPLGLYTRVLGQAVPEVDV